MHKPNLRGFYDTVFLLNMVHMDQSYADAIEMEYRASKTGYDSAYDPTIFFVLK